MLEIGQRIIAILKIERINVWLFNEDKSNIKSLSEYDLRTKKFSKDTVIPRILSPKYFESIERNQILVVPDVYKSEHTFELINSYLIPYNIVSLMDIPLRISGELVGVICFEKTGTVSKNFSEKEQSFGFSVSLVLTSILESKFNKEVKKKLKILIDENIQLKTENKILSTEIADRSTISLQLFNNIINNLKQCNPNLLSDEYSFYIEKYLSRIFAINEIITKHSKGNLLLFNIFLTEIINHFKITNSTFNKAVKSFIDEEQTNIDYRKALNIGVIIFEIIENSLNYSFTNEHDFLLIISLTKRENQQICLTIGDNGNQFNFTQKLNDKAIGINLISFLSKDSLLLLKTPQLTNNHYELIFK
jgi:two-component sensor histidine kinase